jgi:sialic acid synthase SpsE
MRYFKNLKDYGFKTENRTYVIAEAGINHGGDMEVAKKLIESAKRSGCDVVKFQTYLTEKRTPANSPIFDILKKCELSFKDFEVLKKCASDNGIQFFSTPFDDESVDFLTDLGLDLFKVASFDVPNHKFLKKVASKKIPVIISTGMSNMEEIEKAYAILREGTKNIGMLHCVSAYPTLPEQSNLSSIFTLKSKFDCVIGHSDHTNGIEVPLMAVAAGAQIIEKHYKITDDMECIDGPVSISENQMKQMIERIRFTEDVFGNDSKSLLEIEQGCVQYRRNS